MFKPTKINEKIKLSAENTFKSIYPGQELSYDKDTKNYYTNSPDSNEIMGPISLYELCTRMLNE
jgi:hypothetical protein|tara:strand:+ start:5384 stop:5575 length:192 start_codon:yes stop_codon:yes gene_type:complete